MIKYIIIIVYIVSMIVVGIISSRKIKSEGDFFVAGKKGSVWQITGSLLATILGSSAILGTADLALTQGWAASWLLLCASFGLFMLVPVSMKVRRLGKFTLPQMIGDFYGTEAKMISSLIISIAWIGIIAAQIIGAAKIMTGFTGLDYYTGVWGAADSRSGRRLRLLSELRPANVTPHLEARSQHRKTILGLLHLSQVPRHSQSMSESTLSPFQRLTSDGARQAVYAELKDSIWCLRII